MLETLVLVTATTGLFALALGVRGNERFGGAGALIPLGDQRGEDLPCPWCYGPTDETDSHCGGCGRRFG